MENKSAPTTNYEKYVHRPIIESTAAAVEHNDASRGKQIDSPAAAAASDVGIQLGDLFLLLSLSPEKRKKEKKKKLRFRCCSDTEIFILSHLEDDLWDSTSIWCPICNPKR